MNAQDPRNPPISASVRCGFDGVRETGLCHRCGSALATTALLESLAISRPAFPSAGGRWPLISWIHVEVANAAGQKEVWRESLKGMDQSRDRNITYPDDPPPAGSAKQSELVEMMVNWCRGCLGSPLLRNPEQTRQFSRGVAQPG